MAASLHRHSFGLRLLAASGAWLAATGATVALAPLLERSVYLLFWCAVLFAAWFSGRLIAIGVAIASVCYVNYRFIPPSEAFELPTAGEALSLVLFVVVSTVVGGLTSRLAESRRELQLRTDALAEANEQLQEQAIELEHQSAQSQELASQAEELNATLTARTAALEASDRAKSEFLATMSHELRTPINAALGYADLLLAGVRGTLGETQREDVERIRRSQQRLMGLVNHVLSFARLEAGSVEYNLEAVPVGRAIARLDEVVRPLADARGLTLRAHRIEEGWAVQADPERLDQILINLLTNAVKFTAPAGAVWVEARTVGDRGCISVHDTGAGIEPDHLERIFEPFVQADHGLTRRTEGTGLGLAISRQLARGMGGDITVESMPGRGSVFNVLLPLAPSASPSHRPAGAAGRP